MVTYPTVIMPAARLHDITVAAPVNDQIPSPKPRKARTKVKSSTKFVSECSIAREVPIGWRGKGPSKQAYAEFGAANGLAIRKVVEEEVIQARIPVRRKSLKTWKKIV